MRERLIDVSFRDDDRHQNEKALFPLLTFSDTSTPESRERPDQS
jgi:hypothetical protein